MMRDICRSTAVFMYTLVGTIFSSTDLCAQSINSYLWWPTQVDYTGTYLVDGHSSFLYDSRIEQELFDYTMTITYKIFICGFMIVSVLCCIYCILGLLEYVEHRCTPPVPRVCRELNRKFSNQPNDRRYADVPGVKLASTEKSKVLQGQIGLPALSAVPPLAGHEAPSALATAVPAASACSGDSSLDQGEEALS
jgi:hypothetical protein